MNTKFKVYAPLTKQHNLEDGALTITGLASTTNKDLQGDIVLPSAIKSMKQQATSCNLHGDHQYGLFDGVIGSITEVLETDENQLKIKSQILSKYASEIQEMLDIGINLGLSIGGEVTDYNSIKSGWEIKDIDLYEISLTAMPANIDTFGTITSNKGLVKSTCISGACYQLYKNNRKELENMAIEENKPEEKPQEETPLTKNEAVDLFNELMGEKEQEISDKVCDILRPDLEQIVKDVIDKKEGKPEEKEEDDEKKPDEELKSLLEAVSDATAEKTHKIFEDNMSKLFKNINENRENNTGHVDKSLQKYTEEDTTDEVNKEFTPSEIAEAVYKRNNTPSRFLQNMIN